MFSRKSFFKIFIVAFVIFALVKNKSKTIHLPEQEAPKYEFLNDIRSSIDVLTAEPKSRNFTNKNDPILPVNYEDEFSSKPTSPQTNLQDVRTNTNSNSPTNQKSQSISKLPSKKNSNSNINDNLISTNNDQSDSKTWLEHKILNVADNLLHSPQGQALLEKFLLNREQVPKHLSKSDQLKDPHHNNSIIEIIKGNGKPVQCGDIVSAHYIIRLVNGQEVENTHYSDKPLTFQVGNQKVIKGLEYAVLGMQEGGRRRLVVPPKMAYNQTKFSKGIIPGNEFVTIDVELLKIDPINQNEDNKIRIFNDISDSYNFPLMCSDPIFFNYTITTLNDKLLAKSDKHVSFILGSDSVPPAINKAFANIKLKSKRTVIMPSNLIYNKEISFLPTDVKLPSNEFILFEVDTN